MSPAEAAAAVTDLRRFRRGGAADHVTAFTGLASQSPCPPARVVDRKDWAAANIAGLRCVVTPLAENLANGRTPGPVLDAIGSRLTACRAGTVLGTCLGGCSVSTTCCRATLASCCW